tara:strand:+ start:480 stop:893 length:414 start_codon:yes stop_codon:yes gene_type:complete
MVTRQLVHDFPFRDMMIGFDDFFQTADRLSGNQKYPPYNIAKHSDEHYSIEIALAGWSKDQLTIEEHNGKLTIKGEKPNGMTATEFVYKGIGNRAFTREFKLTEHMHVSDADLADGILSVDLILDIPEALKPKRISL